MTVGWQKEKAQSPTMMTKSGDPSAGTTRQARERRQPAEAVHHVRNSTQDLDDEMDGCSNTRSSRSWSPTRCSFDEKIGFHSADDGDALYGVGSRGRKFRRSSPRTWYRQNAVSLSANARSSFRGIQVGQDNTTIRTKDSQMRSSKVDGGHAADNVVAQVQNDAKTVDGLGQQHEPEPSWIEADKGEDQLNTARYRDQWLALWHNDNVALLVADQEAALELISPLSSTAKVIEKRGLPVILVVEKQIDNGLGRRGGCGGSECYEKPKTGGMGSGGTIGVAPSAADGSSIGDKRSACCAQGGDGGRRQEQEVVIEHTSMTGGNVMATTADTGTRCGNGVNANVAVVSGGWRKDGRELIQEKHDEGTEPGEEKATSVEREKAKMKQVRDQSKRLALEIARLRGSLRRMTVELEGERAARLWLEVGIWRCGGTTHG